MFKVGDRAVVLNLDSFNYGRIVTIVHIESEEEPSYLVTPIDLPRSTELLFQEDLEPIMDSLVKETEELKLYDWNLACKIMEEDKDILKKLGD